MTNPVLSILIPTVNGREQELGNLLAVIRGNRLWDEVSMTHEGYSAHLGKSNDGLLEFIVLKDNKEMTIGEKREGLYQMANGEYSIQTDDDNSLSEDAIELILEALKEKPDCVTFRESVTIDGKYESSNHSLMYPKWADNFDGFRYVRSPFYADVIKTSIAKSVPFAHIRYGEDIEWSERLYPHLNTEIHIDKEILLYQHTSSDFKTRYGITE